MEAGALIGVVVVMVCGEAVCGVVGCGDGVRCGSVWLWLR